MKKAPMDQKSPGFSLVELLVALSIISVVSAATVSNLNASIPRYKFKKAVSEIVSMLQCARLRAVKENSPVVVLFDPDGNGRLEGDYIAFVDNSADALGDWAWQPEAGEPLVARGHLPEGVRFTRTSFSKDRLRFDSQGHQMGINRSLYLKNSDGLTQKITVYSSGNIRAFKR